MKNNKIIFHLDLNYFFCRCEEIINPILEKKYFVVANNNNGIVSTSNKLARTKNIKSAMLVSEAKKLCNELIIVESHFDLYSKMSKAFFDCLTKHYSNEIEIMSIDECFMDVTYLLDKYHGNIDILASDMIKTVYEETKLYVTIGIGNSKFLAKMAGDTKPENKIAKIFYEDIKEKIWTLDINKIVGIGSKTSNLFKSLNISTVNDFINYENQDYLKRILHKKYYYLLNCFTGNSDDEIDFSNKDKSLSQSRTLTTPEDDEIQIKSTLRWLCQELSKIIDNHNYAGNKIGVQIKYWDNNEIKSLSKTFNEYYFTFDSIYKIASNMFDNLWNGKQIKLIGVNLSNIINKDNIKLQNHLF